MRQLHKPFPLDIWRKALHKPSAGMKCPIFLFALCFTAALELTVSKVLPPPASPNSKQRPGGSEIRPEKEPRENSVEFMAPPASPKGLWTKSKQSIHDPTNFVSFNDGATTSVVHWIART